MKTCTQCGSQIPANATTCPICGAPQNTAPASRRGGMAQRSYDDSYGGGQGYGGGYDDQGGYDGQGYGGQDYDGGGYDDGYGDQGQYGGQGYGGQGNGGYDDQGGYGNGGYGDGYGAPQQRRAPQQQRPAQNGYGQPRPQPRPAQRNGYPGVSYGDQGQYSAPPRQAAPQNGRPAPTTSTRSVPQQPPYGAPAQNAPAQQRPAPAAQPQQSAPAAAQHMQLQSPAAGAIQDPYSIDASGTVGDSYDDDEEGGYKPNQEEKVLGIVAYATWVGFLLGLLKLEGGEDFLKLNLNESVIVHIFGTFAVILHSVPVVNILLLLITLVPLAGGLYYAIKGETTPLPVIGKLQLID